MLSSSSLTRLDVLEDRAEAALLVVASVQTHFFVEIGALVAFAIGLGEDSQWDLGAAANGTVGERVADAAAALNQSWGRYGGGEEGKASHSEERDKSLHFVMGAAGRQIF